MNIPVELTSVNYPEMKDEAERLSRTLKRDVEARLFDCDCNYSKDCGYCGGQGYVFAAAFAFCGHVVQDGPDETCIKSDCAHREYVASIEREEQIDAMEVV